ncbi:MAG: hypothetical protein U5K74_14050 [Gemmatimonadaceae bacterium]|nr:hypothetical protein [Gemmatimonadaceae bacterium]
MSDDAPTGRRWTLAITLMAAVCAVAAVVGVPLLRAERTALQRETVALRAAQATAAQALDSLRGARDVATATLVLERARAGAREEPKLHLVIAVDSGTVALVRDGITLRSMPARFRGAAPARGTQTIAQIAESVVPAVAPTVDSLGNAVRAALPETTVERVTLTDGTVIEGGDASAALLGGVEVAPGPRMILVARRDFAAIRPNLVKGMKAVLF